MAPSRRSRRLTMIDPNDVYLNPDIRESDAEALERHRLYYDAAFATLSPPAQVAGWGLVAGLLTNLLLSAGLAVFLALVVNFEVLVLNATPRSWGAPTDPAWIGLLRPAWGALVLLPGFALAGLACGLLRRWGHQRAHTLDHYFLPSSPRADAIGFWLFMALTVWFGFWWAGLLRPDDDMLGVLFYMAGAGSVFAWPLHVLWLRLHLTLLRRYSRVREAQIQAMILAMIGPGDDGPALTQWRRQAQTLFEARKARQATPQPPSRSA